jgi:hypothetical protein
MIRGVGRSPIFGRSYLGEGGIRASRERDGGPALPGMAELLAPSLPWGCPRSGFTPPNVDWCEQNLCERVVNPAGAWSDVLYVVLGIWLWRETRRRQSRALALFARQRRSEDLRRLEAMPASASLHEACGEKSPIRVRLPDPPQQQSSAALRPVCSRTSRRGPAASRPHPGHRIGLSGELGSFRPQMGQIAVSLEV